MAKAINNLLLSLFSGTIGNQLTVSQRNGMTILSRKRGKSRVPPTAKQLQVRERMKYASKYASSVILDDGMKALYAAAATPAQNAFNVALKDAYNAPEIKHVDTQRYKGNTGDSITAHAIDDFRVYKVTVTIFDQAAGIIEKGDAVMQRNGKDWKYTAVQTISEGKGVKILVMAEDLPGNKTYEEVILTL